MNEIEEKSAYESLKPKDRRMIDEYLVNGLVQWRAYKKCIARTNTSDESCRVLSSEYFANLNIQEAISERLEREAMGKAEALHRLGAMARNTQMQYLKADGSVDLAQLIEDGYAHLVKETDYKGKDADRLVVRFYNVPDQLNKILKALGAFNHTQSVEHSGPEGGPIPLRWDDEEEG